MTEPPDHDAAARRLLNALAAEPNSGDHAPVQDRLPEFVEAELAGEDAAARFPDVQAHLDTCEICSHLYAELVDVLLADASGDIAPARDWLPVKLPASVVVRRRVRAVAARALAGLGLGLADLEAALETGLQDVFGGQVPTAMLTAGHVVAERATARYGTREAAAVATAAYNVMMIMTAASPGSLLAEQSGGHSLALLRRVAAAEAVRAHLTAEATPAFVEAAVNQFGENYGELVDLAGRSDVNR